MDKLSFNSLLRCGSITVVLLPLEKSIDVGVMGGDGGRTAVVVVVVVRDGVMGEDTIKHGCGFSAIPSTSLSPLHL